MANTTRTRNAERNYNARMDYHAKVSEALDTLNAAVAAGESLGSALPRVADQYGFNVGEMAAHYDAQ